MNLVPVPKLFHHSHDVNAAITREKQLKKWKRSWKLRLIETVNPEWKDLYEESLQDWIPAFAGMTTSLNLQLIYERTSKTPNSGVLDLGLGACFGFGILDLGFPA